MRALAACLVLAGLATTAGCPSDNGAVRLDVSQAVGVSPPIAGYSASNAAFATDPNGFVHFTANSNQGVLTMRLGGPLGPSQVIDLAAGGDTVDFTVGDAVWSATGGTLAVESLRPLIIGFSTVTMTARSAAASGDFVFDGAGTFR